MYIVITWTMVRKFHSFPQSLKGLIIFPLRTIKCGVGRQGETWGGERPSQTEGLEKTGKGGRASFEWEEEFTR